MQATVDRRVCQSQRTERRKQLECGEKDSRDIVQVRPCEALGTVFVVGP